MIKNYNSLGDAATTATAAAASAATGGILPGIVTVASYITQLFKIGNKPTEHLNYQEALPTAQALGSAIRSALQQNLSSSQYAQLNASAGTQYSNWINQSNWWKKGNDVAAYIIPGIASKTLDQGALDNFFMWAFMNAPKNNADDAFNATNEMFDAVLYPQLTSFGASNLVQNIKDNLVAAKTGQMPTQTTPAGGGGGILDQLKNLFSPSKNAANSGTKTASLFSETNLVIGGVMAFIFAGMLITLRNQKRK